MYNHAPDLWHENYTERGVATRPTSDQSALKVLGGLHFILLALLALTALLALAATRRCTKKEHARGSLL